MQEFMEIASLRAEGARLLRVIAEENGAHSILFRRCRELWVEREVGAFLSLTSGDCPNALTLLRSGIHVLVHGPDVLKKDGLPLDDVMSLLGAA